MSGSLSNELLLEHENDTSADFYHTSVDLSTEEDTEHLSGKQPWSGLRGIPQTAWVTISVIIGALSAILIELYAWKAYWVPSQQRHSFLTSEDVSLVCDSTVTVSSITQCRISTLKPALISDFGEPCYRIKETSETNLQPFRGKDGGVFFEFSFIAPKRVGRYTVELLTVTDSLSHSTQVSARVMISVVHIQPNQVSLHCIGSLSQIERVQYSERIECVIHTDVAVEQEVFDHTHPVFVDGQPYSFGPRPFISPGFGGKNFTFELEVDCKPRTMLIQVALNSEMFQSPTLQTSMVHWDGSISSSKSFRSPQKVSDDKQPFLNAIGAHVSVVSLFPNQAHLRCWNPRTNLTTVSISEPVQCEITTDIPVTVQDFADPPISTVPMVYDLTALSTLNHSSDECAQSFRFTFTSPPIDQNISVKGHIRAGNALFAEDPFVMDMGHVSPLPEDLNFTCVGELSRTAVMLHKERMICQIESDYEFLMDDFIQDVFTTNGRGLSLVSAKGTEHRRGKRPGTHHDWLLTFNVTDTDTSVLMLVLTLKQMNKRVNEEPRRMTTVSCPRDGPEWCVHWKFEDISPSQLALTLLPSRKTNHPYGSDPSWTVFKGFPSIGKVTALILDRNRFEEFPDNFFEPLSSLMELSAVNNDVKQLRDHTFKGLKNLVTLDLTNNEIVNISYLCFGRMLRLRSLILEGNQLDQVPSLHHVLHLNGPELRELNVRRNGLKTFEESVIEFPMLRDLRIGGHFTCLPSFFFGIHSWKVQEMPIGEDCRCPGILMTNLTNQEQFGCKHWRINPVCLQWVMDEPDQGNRRICKQDGWKLSHIGSDMHRIDNVDSLNLTGMSSLVNTIDLRNNHLKSFPETFLRKFKQNLISVNVSNNPIRKLHSGLFQNSKVEVIHLKNCSLLDLPPSLFGVSVVDLDLSNNYIREILENTLDDLPELNSLDISHNRITEIYDQGFLAHSDLLEYLRMNNNDLKRLNPNWFESKSKMRILDVSFNQLKSLNKHLFKSMGYELGIINFGHNPLSYIPNHLFHPSVPLTRLMEAYFDHCNIDTIAQDFLPNAQWLVRLDLSHNEISEIPESSFKHFRQLQFFNVGHNRLITLDAGMFGGSTNHGFSHVNWLVLSGNPISHIQPGFFSQVFPHIRRLELEGTNVTDFKLEDFQGLDRIQVLHLSHNEQLKELKPEQFKHVSNTLTELHLRNTAVESLTQEIIGNMSQLEWLTLSNNEHWNWIGPDTFKHCPLLTRLNLSHTHLTQSKLSEHFLRDSNIQELDLDDGWISELNKQWFDDTAYTLRTMSFRMNNVSWVKQNTFDQSQSLNKVDLRDNPVQCTPQWMDDLEERIEITLSQPADYLMCVSCPKGEWSNGTNHCQPCSDIAPGMICLNDEWDETGTFRLRGFKAGNPPRNIKFTDIDPNPNMIGGSIQWDLPLEQVNNTDQWSLYISMDGGKTANGEAIAIVDFEETTAEIPIETEVDKSRTLVMFARNSGGNGDTHADFHFDDLCHICISDLSFNDEDPRPGYIRGTLKFRAPIKEESLKQYAVFRGDTPYEVIMDAIHTEVIQHDEPVGQYSLFLQTFQSFGSEYLIVKSYYFTDGVQTEQQSDTGAYQYLKITDLSRESISDDEQPGGIVGDANVELLH